MEILVKTNVSPVMNHYKLCEHLKLDVLLLFPLYFVVFFITVGDMNHVDSKQHMQNISKLKWSKSFDVIITMVKFKNK